MIPLWWLPVIVLVLVVAAARMAVWCCDPMNAEAADLRLSPRRRRAAHEQELRDIDAWLLQVRKVR